MKYKLLPVLLSFLLLGVGCAVTQTTTSQEQGISLVTTTTMLQDLAEIIGGEHINATCLLTVGVDPHLYEATAKDVTTLENAEIILYHGLHLEGKMGDLLENMEQGDKTILSVEKALPSPLLLADEDNPSAYDPHVWFDVGLWEMVASYLAQSLSTLDPDHAEDYQANLQDYLAELSALEEEIVTELEKIPPQSRVLITAHDAFQYFGNAYNVEVRGIQGTATNTEATTQDMSNLADFIVEREIKAIFVETSVSSKNMEALQEAVVAQGFSVEIGGELYSDSLGEGEHSTYVETFRANLHTMVQALEGGTT